MKILLAMSLLYPSFAIAKDSPSKSQLEVRFQAEVQDRAKRRQYPGGRDEMDLKVQTQIVKPSRKVLPVVEEPAEADDVHD